MKAEDTTLLNGRVTLKQSTDGLRASMDSVLLACAVTANAGDHILDMGCGTGAVGLCALYRNPGIHLHGLDIQSDMIDLAKQNNTDANYHVGDVADKHLFEPENFDQIVMNPPYYKDGERQASPDDKREKAYTGDLEIWMKSALHWVKQGGVVTLIHRADALMDILALAKGKFGAVEIRPIHSKASEPANRVVVRMVRNRKTPLKIHPPIVMFNDDGEESAQAISLLRNGHPLF